MNNLIVAVAHAGDAELWAGMAIAQRLLAGERVHVLVACSPDLGRADTTTRIGNQKRIAAQMGYTVSFGGFSPSPWSADETECFKMWFREKVADFTAQEFRRSGMYNDILTHNLHGEYSHPKHREINEALASEQLSSSIVGFFGCSPSRSPSSSVLTSNEGVPVLHLQRTRSDGWWLLQKPVISSWVSRER